MNFFGISEEDKIIGLLTRNINSGKPIPVHFLFLNYRDEVDDETVPSDIHIPTQVEWDVLVAAGGRWKAENLVRQINRTYAAQVSAKLRFELGHVDLGVVKNQAQGFHVVCDPEAYAYCDEHKYFDRKIETGKCLLVGVLGLSVITDDHFGWDDEVMSGVYHSQGLIDLSFTAAYEKNGATHAGHVYRLKMAK